MSFASVTVGLLLRPGDAPQLTDADDARLQDAHLAHLAALHDRGLLVAAGPLVDQDDERVRGIALFAATVEAARRAMDDDPKVRAGVLDLEFATWLVPDGALRFGEARFPRSLADVRTRDVRPA